MSDFDLLQEYGQRRSEEAFRTLVGRCANLVFSAALRHTRDLQAAEDVTQAVFIILARKSGALPRTTILCGWLLRTVRFVALNTLRRETHRRQTEKEAMSLYTTEGDAAWERIAPVLDEVLCGLSDNRPGRSNGSPHTPRPHHLRVGR
jgi:DNA-directed RNA polymerase specialized sigma24 family protein